MTQRSSSILLALVVFTIVFVEKAEGFFLDNIISETTTEEPPISITTTNVTQQIVDSVKNIVDHVENTQKDDNNQTQQYHVDIQMNFIDSDPKNLANEEDNDVREIHPEEPIVLDLGNEFQNITSSTTDKDNATLLKESVGNTNVNEAPIDELSKPELEQIIPEGQQNADQINESDVNLDTTLEEVSLELNTVPNLDQTISTLAPIKDETTRIDNAIETQTTSHVAETTPSIDIQQENPSIPTHRIEKIQDLSIFFENEPTRARQLRGFNKEIDNEIISQGDDGSGSDSSSNISQSSESESNLSFSPDISPGQDENHAAEHLSMSENVSTEKTLEIKSPQEQTTMTTQTHLNISNNAEPNNGLLTDVATEEESTKSVSTDSIEDIEAVTKSIQEITEKVSKAPHNVIKKPGVDDEVSSPSHVTVESIQESTNEIQVTTPASTELNPVVNFVLNRTVVEIESLSTAKVFETSPLPLITMAEIPDSVDPNQNTTKQVEEEDSQFIPFHVMAPTKITEQIVPENIQPSEPEDKSEAKSISEPEALEKDKEMEENIKPVQLNVEKASDHQNNALDVNEQNSLPEQQRSLKPHPEKDSKEQNDESISGLNDIPNSEKQGEKALEAHLVMDNIETSTKTPSVKSNEASLFEEVQGDQTSKVENGIFKEKEEAPLKTGDESLPDPKLYEEEVETSTENPVMARTENPTTASLENTQFGSTKDYVRHVGSLQTMRDETSSAISDEVIAPAAVGRSLNEIVAEGLGKPLPTRSVGDEPSTSSYSSEDKTTTVLVLCAAAGGIFIAFSVAIYLITFQRQHGTLDIEMQEQQCGKDDLDDDEDSQTRVSLLNQHTMVDSDEHSSD